MSENTIHDYRKVIPQTPPVVTPVSQTELYEMQFEVLEKPDWLGEVEKLRVRRSIDGGKTWSLVRFRRNWRQQFWRSIVRSLWERFPPAPRDIDERYVCHGKYCFSYSYLPGSHPQSRTTVTQAQYDPLTDCWTLQFLKFEQ